MELTVLALLLAGIAAGDAYFTRRDLRDARATADSRARVIAEKNERLRILTTALGAAIRERDNAVEHAEDTQELMAMIVGEQVARERHPAGKALLTVVQS